MVFAFSQPRSTRRYRCRLRRACRDCVMLHLRGVAPPMSPYRRSPFPAFYRPILSGLWPPSRSFDRGIAPEADASRTLCAGIPANEILVRSPPLLSFRSGSRPEVKELRSVPPPLHRRARSNLSAGDPSAGHGGEGFVAKSFDLLTAMKQVPRVHCWLREGMSLGLFRCRRHSGPRTQAPCDVCARIPRGSARHILRCTCEVAVGLLAKVTGLVPPSTRAGWPA
jgi:hypothetical protein